MSNKIKIILEGFALILILPGSIIASPGLLLYYLIDKYFPSVAVDPKDIHCWECGRKYEEI